MATNSPILVSAAQWQDRFTLFSPRTAQALHWTHCYMELIGILMGSPILVSAAQWQGRFTLFSPRTAQALHWTHCYMELIGILMGSPILVSAAQRQGHFSTSLLRWCKHYVVPIVKCSVNFYNFMTVSLLLWAK